MKRDKIKLTDLEETKLTDLEELSLTDLDEIAVNFDELEAKIEDIGEAKK